MSLRAQTASAVKWTMVASTVVAGSEILRNIVLARFLFPVDFGLMAMVTIVIGLAQMYCDMGMSAAVIYRQDATDDQLSSLYWLNIFSGWTVFAVVWLSTPLITKFYNEPRLPLLLKAVAVVFLITPVCSQFENLLQKELAFDFLAKRDICTSACQTVVAVTFAALGFGVWSLVYGYLINAALRAGLLVHVGFTRYRPRFHFKTSDLKGYLSFGLFQLGERTAFYLSQRSDQVMIGSLLGAQALGYYSFAFNLAAQPLSRINPILTKVAFPAFSRVQDDVVRLRRGYMKLVGILTTFNAPLLIGLAAVAPWAVPTIFGAKWTPAVVLVQILSFLTLLRSINNPIGSVQYAKGRADLGFLWHTMTLIFSVPVIYLGCRTGQVTSVALWLLIFQVCLAVPLYLLMVRPLLGKCAMDYARVILRPTAVALAMGLAVLTFASVFNTLPMKIEFAVQVLLGALVYLTLLYAFHREAIVDIKSAIFSR